MLPLIGLVRRSFSLLSPRERRHIAALAAASLLLNLLDLLALASVGALGAVALGGDSFFSSWTANWDKDRTTMILLAFATVTFALKTVGGIQISRKREHFLAELEAAASEKIGRHIFGSGLEIFKSQSRAELDWAVLRSTRTAFGIMIGKPLELFSEVSLAVLVLVVFVIADPLSAIVVFTYFASVLSLFQLVSGKESEKTGVKFAESSVVVSQVLTDLAATFKEAQVQSRIGPLLEKLSQARLSVARAGAHHHFVQSLPRLVVELALIIGAILYVSVQMFVLPNEADWGAIGVFIVGSLRIMSALLPIQRAATVMRYEAPQARAAQDLVKAASAEPDLDRSVHENLPRREGAAGVDIRDVRFSYQDSDCRTEVLSGVTLKVDPGGTVAFIGPSGAGKSTLVDTILGLLDPSSGHVLISGVPPTVFRRSNRSAMGYVPQKPGMVSGTIRDNIVLGLAAEEIDEVKLWRAVEQADLEKFLASLPDGLDTSFGEHADSFSGGQIQRIGLARALYDQPSLLVLDEATSSLDAKTEDSVAEAVKRVGAQTTTIIVAHRLSTIQHADIVYVIDGGKVVAQGSLRQLVETVPIVQDYLRLMSVT